MSKEMDFVVDFLKYYDGVGIQDKLDRQSNRMVTSPGVYSLVQQARALMPERLSKEVAAAKMKVLEDRDEAIKASPDKIHDARGIFSRKMAENGGARGILSELMEAMSNGDTERVAALKAMAITFTQAERGENVFDSKENE